MHFINEWLNPIVQLYCLSHVRTMFTYFGCPAKVPAVAICTQCKLLVRYGVGLWICFPPRDSGNQRNNSAINNGRYSCIEDILIEDILRGKYTTKQNTPRVGSVLAINSKQWERVQMAKTEKNMETSCWPRLTWLCHNAQCSRQVRVCT